MADDIYHGLLRPKQCDFCGELTDTPCRSLDQAAGCLIAAGKEPMDDIKQKLSEEIANAPYGGVFELPKDNVHQPAHYARRKMQAIEYIAINNLEWWEANVVKYIARYDAKDGLQDLYKARSYLDMKIRQLEAHERFWEKPVAIERALNGSK